MRMMSAVGTAAFLAAVGPAWAAEESFDACEVFTQADAEKALGGAAAGEPAHPNPKYKRPKGVPPCTYTGFKDGHPLSASVQVRFGQNQDEAPRPLDANKNPFQT